MTKQERQRWLIAIGLFVSLFFLWGGAYNTSPVFLSALIKSQGWSHERTALIPSVLALANGLAAPLAGWLLDRIEARIVMSAGALLALLGLLAASHSQSFAGLVAANLVLGAGLGASTWLPASLVIANWFGERRGTALGLCTAGMESGGMVMTIFLGWIIAQGDWHVLGFSLAGWRMAYLIVAIPVLAVALPLFLFIIQTRPKGEAVTGQSAETVREAANRLPGLETRVALRTRAFWMLVVCQLVFGLGVGMVFIHMVAFLRNVGYQEEMAALVVGVMLGIAAVGKPTFGAVADRIGGKNSMGFSFIGAAVGILIMLTSKAHGLPVIGALITGFSGAVPVALVPMVLAETLGLKRFGTLFGWLGLVVTVGLSFGPIISGRLFDLSGSYALPFEIAVAINLGAAAASFACVAPAAMHDELNLAATAAAGTPRPAV